jgi:hypothetical protein
MPIRQTVAAEAWRALAPGGGLADSELSQRKSVKSKKLCKRASPPLGDAPLADSPSTWRNSQRRGFFFRPLFAAGKK